MSQLESLFAPESFRSKIQEFADTCEIKLAKLTDSFAAIDMTGRSGRIYAVCLCRYDTLVEFSCWSSVLSYGAEADIPSYVAVKLLRDNATNKRGFWCLAHINDKFLPTYMYNIELSQLDSDVFIDIVVQLVNASEELDNVVGGIHK